MNIRSAGRALLALSLLSLLLVACGDDSTVEEQSDSAALATVPVQESSKSVGITATPESAAGSANVEPVPVDAVSGEPAAPLPTSFAAMLARVGDHQLEVSIAFAGQDTDGRPVAFTLMSSETLAHDPLRTRLDLSVSNDGGLDQIESMSLISGGKAAYLYVPQVGCVSGAIDEFADEMELPLDPRLILEGLSGADVVANGVPVNGSRTTEYRFDETSLPWALANPWSIDGSAFVEEGSGVVVQVSMTLVGRGDLLGDGRVLEGKYDILVIVTEEPDGEAFTLPQACGESALYPLTPDAFEITAIDDLLTFKSRLALEEVVAFYAVEMPAAGYEPSAEPDIFEDLAIMNFAMGETQLIIAAEHDVVSGVVSVLISP